MQPHKAFNPPLDLDGNALKLKLEILLFYNYII